MAVSNPLLLGVPSISRVPVWHHQQHRGMAGRKKRKSHVGLSKRRKIDLMTGDVDLGAASVGADEMIVHEATTTSTTTIQHNQDTVCLGMSASQEQPADSPPLPEGWQEMVDGEGRTYYFNSKLGSVQWTVPEANPPKRIRIPAQPADSPPLPEGWQEMVDGEGRTYYFNSKLRSVQWTVPEASPPKRIRIPAQQWMNLLEIPHLEPITPPFVSQEGWLDDIVGRVTDLCLKEDAADGSYRVPITSLARCSRGGKTRALYELAKALREQCIPTLFVSFNDFSNCDYEILRGDSSLEMLCRRIAFDARPASLRTGAISDDFKAFKKYSITADEVSSFLGTNQVVLLIDELNNVELDKDIVLFLKENFLTQRGRYYVFSSHLSSTNPEKALPSLSFRDMEVKTLPLIQDLSGARQNLSITDLTPRMALYYGLIPALLVTTLTVEGLAEKAQIARRTERACSGTTLDFDLLQRVLGSFFSGEPLGTNIDALLDNGNGKSYWIPCYLMELLGNLADSIQGRFGLSQSQVVQDAKSWSTSKEESGDGWESLFLLVLWLRYVSGNFGDVSCIPTVSFEMKTISTSLFYNYPLPATRTISMVKNLEELQKALGEICSNHHWEGNFPKVSIYYPKFAKFPEYDVFVCLWQKDVKSGVVTYDLYGYQLKEGKEIPNQPATLPNSYLVRGHPAVNPSERRGWTCLARPQLRSFFGVSGKRWLPEQWRELSAREH